MDKPIPAEARRLESLLSAGAAWLSARGVDDARLACELLAARLLDIPRLELTLDRDRVLPPRLVAALRRGVMRLGAGEPLQYVLGEWDFRGHTLKVDRRALVPRPETEQLVQWALDTDSLWQTPAPYICDTGTGSGCIVISLAIERPRGRYLAVERDPDALSLARENAALCGVSERISFRLGEGCGHTAPGSLDAVVSNPPYIRSAALASLSRQIREHEPRQALDGGEDGLLVLRDVIHDSAMALRAGGWCLLEIGDDQGDEVRALLEMAGFTEVTIRRDLAGKVRFAGGRAC
ncbi:MAG: peptide chain release factor N(5)-glutamine methyltransferase [Kiritimatiellae bacterium]|nr:peptide chain release factor N(5)-glutamine methyltransferase [Kiritimatiellia bacterium]